MKKLVGRYAFIVGILFYSTFSHAQINNIYLSHPSFIPSIHTSKSQTFFKNNILFIQNTPFISQYLPKKRDCFYLLASQKSICFNREINIEPMTNRTKMIFFKMKMWKYFR